MRSVSWRASRQDKTAKPGERAAPALHMMISRDQLRLLLPLGTAMALSLTGDSTMYAVLASQIDLLGISLGVVGVLLGANRMVRIPGNLLAGGFYDRSRRRPLFLIGLVLGILSTLGYSLVQGFWPLFAARVLWGIAWSLINVGGYTMILDRSSVADRGRMTGLYQMAFMLGLTISPILGGALTDGLGFRPAARICALVSGLGFLVALVALPETKPEQGAADCWSEQESARWRLPDLFGTLRRIDWRVLSASYIYLVVLFVNSGVLMSTISLYLKQRWGASIPIGATTIGVASLGGLLLALRSALGIVAGPVAGIASDRIGDRWPVVRAGLLLGSSGFVVLALLTSIGAVPIGVALISLSTGALAASVTALVGDLAEGRRQSLTMGGLATAGDIGSALGPIFAYALAVALDLRWVYFACALALGSGLLVTTGQGACTRRDTSLNNPTRRALDD
ncbi:MAG: MFS transporter [Anaerolineae bacterium]|jgi:MFS family permease